MPVLWQTLLFFSDKGLTVKLPPIPDSEDEIVDSKQNKRNVLNILVNSKDQMLVNDEITKVLDLKQLTIDFVNNFGSDPTKSDSPDKAVVSLKNDNGTTYEMYLSVHNELKAAYNLMWNEESMKVFGRNYEELSNEDRRVIREKYPYRISFARYYIHFIVFLYGSNGYASARYDGEICYTTSYRIS